MPINIFKNEKDALSYLGLLSHMFKHFDGQIVAPDGEKSHVQGLNIHALIIDNETGHILGMQQNSIHAFNNPLLHAEQLTLKEAIEGRNRLQPRDSTTTSVESYYRNLLFNDPSSYDALNSGATIYTTLEPCPFCTSALLVSRMKRIVFISPDNTYGNSFYSLWTNFYKRYDIHYEALTLDVADSDIIAKARTFLLDISKKILAMTTVPNNTPGTLYFDQLYIDLNAVSDYFHTIEPSKLKTTGNDLVKNTTLLNDLKARML